MRLFFALFLTLFPLVTYATDGVDPDTYLYTLVYESVDEYGTTWKKYVHISIDTEESDSDILNELDEQADRAGRKRGRFYYIVGEFVQ